MTVDFDLIPFNQHSADERTHVFEFASVNIHIVVFMFDIGRVPPSFSVAALVATLKFTPS